MIQFRIAFAVAAAVLAAAPLGSAVARAAKAPEQASARPALPFIDDDFDRALAEAKQRDLPLFVESWAPW